MWPKVIISIENLPSSLTNKKLCKRTWNDHALFSALHWQVDLDVLTFFVFPDIFCIISVFQHIHNITRYLISYITCVSLCTSFTSR